MINAKFNTEVTSSTYTPLPKFMVLGSTAWKLPIKQRNLKWLTSKTMVKNIYHLSEVRWSNVPCPLAHACQNHVSKVNHFEEIARLILGHTHKSKLCYARQSFK